MSLEEIPFCDEYYPTYEDMQNFQSFMTKCENQSRSGIIKVIPPPGYKAREADYSNLDFTIPHPIEQIINGNNGVYDLIYIQREAKLLSKYKKASLSNEKVIENKKHLDIEKLFWRTIKFSAPIYGADTPGSIFDENVPWNLSELDSILKKGLDKDIQGVTTPYLYIGAWKTLFAWHKEDLDLYSINYLHFGKPKCWYGIPAHEAEKFDEFARRCFPESYKTCPEFLRHKTYLINPSLLLKNGITVHKAVQNPGEFVITFAKTYHAGFNMGFNCAEAVNFALNRWIEIGRNAKPCKCSKDSVKIDLNYFCENLKETKLSEKSNLCLILVDSEISSKKKMRKKREKKCQNEALLLECEKCKKIRKIRKISQKILKIKNHFECNKAPELGYVCKYVNRMKKKAKKVNNF